MQTYLFLGLFVLFILQIVSLCSNNWYGKDDYNWGFYNRCSNNSCIDINTYGSNKVFLYICKSLMWFSILATITVIFILHFNPNIKHKAGIILYASSVMMLTVICLSIKFRTVNYFTVKKTGTPRSTLIICFIACIISFGIGYLLHT